MASLLRIGIEPTLTNPEGPLDRANVGVVDQDGGEVGLPGLRLVRHLRAARGRRACRDGAPNCGGGQDAS